MRNLSNFSGKVKGIERNERKQKHKNHHKLIGSTLIKLRSTTIYTFIHIQRRELDMFLLMLSTVFPIPIRKM